MPRHLNSNQLLDDLEIYFRRLRLKEFFSECDKEEQDEGILFHPPSTWMPLKRRDPALETYVKGVRNDTQTQIKKLRRVRSRDYLLPSERLALKNLRRRQDIVIKPADKGSSVVVLSKEDYIMKAEQQVSNTDYY